MVPGVVSGGEQMAGVDAAGERSAHLEADAQGPLRPPSEGVREDAGQPMKHSAGMSARQARRIERSIIALCVLSLALIFQPFSLRLFGVGSLLVVVAGLAFNLVPLCRPGVPARSVLRAAAIVLAVLLGVFALAIASAHLYALYLQSR